MTFEEILDKASAMLKRRRRVSYRILKRQFDLDDAQLEDLKFELINVQRIGIEEEGTILTWIGDYDATQADISKNRVLSREQRQSAAERRQLTVMFIDLVGSTDLSRQLDPEDLRDIIYDYQDLFDLMVTKHQGLVVQHQGDGIVAYFGYPIAHEDDARRAVMSGLATLKALNDMNLRLSKEKKITLEVRIGIHTGLVVVGATGGQGHSEMTAIGETPNLAARIQSVAKPNSIVISAATNKLVQEFFEIFPLGAMELKGFTELIQLYIVIGEKARGRFDLGSGDSVTLLIGRERERAQLLAKWKLAQQSHGQVALIGGEAGIGKSRLVRSIVKEIVHSEITLLNFNCSAHHRNNAFEPFIETLQHEIKLNREEHLEISLTKIKRYLISKGLTDVYDFAICASLLSIPLKDSFEDFNMSAERRKTLTSRFLVRWLLEKQKPSLVLIEDLHWADPSTLELLGQIINQIAPKPVLLIATFRPEFQPAWVNNSYVRQIILSRLNRVQAETLILQLAKNLPPMVIHDLVTKTDGNPLFVEEVTKFVLESGVLEESEGSYQLKGSLKSISIPNTLKDSLMARLDRLGASKEVAQIGATIGREFSYSLVKAISQLDETILDAHLSKLVVSQLLVSNGEIPNVIFTFKHSLIQETAYNSLLRKRRLEFHRRIVETLEKSFPAIVETKPELLAYHCTQASLLERALPYWRQAGEHAVNRSAHAEAINHLNEGLAILSRLPESQQRVHDEIMFQIALGVPLTSLRGYGSSEVERAYARARELCQEAGETFQLIPALYGLWRYYLLRADYQEALKLSNQILSLSRHSNDPVHLVVANRASGSTHFYLGALDQAMTNFQEIFDSKTSPDRRAGTLLYDVVDAWVTARSYASWTLWLQGYPDQAKEKSKSALIMTSRLRHPFSLALVQSFSAWLYQFRGENNQTLKCAQKGLSIAEENGFGFWVGWGKILKYWVKDVEEGGDYLSSIRDGLTAWNATGSELGSSYFLFLYGERLLAHGDHQGTWQCITDAKAFIKRTGEQWWEAEIFRLEGMFHSISKNPDTEKAELCFRAALKIASDQKARSLELRAATNLARLLANTRHQSECYLQLKEIVDWFKEGLELPDMLEAQSVLKSISDLE